MNNLKVCRQRNRVRKCDSEIVHISQLMSNKYHVSHSVFKFCTDKSSKTHYLCIYTHITHIHITIPSHSIIIKH